MSELTLKFGDVVVNKKEFHASKQAIALNLVDTDKMMMMVVNTLLVIYIMIMSLGFCVLYCLE